MQHRPRARLAWLVAPLLLAACSAPARPPRFDTGFRGPGRLVVIFELADPESPRALVVHDANGARELPIAGARAARWLSADELLVSREAPSGEPYGLPLTELVRVDADSGAATPIGQPARYFDAEPDRRGERIAVGLEVDDQGESDLLVLALADPNARPMAGRSQPLDRPRWSPDGTSLVVLQTLVDPDGEDSETGLSFGGQAVAWPRLFRAPADLRGKLALLHDGNAGESLAPGGSLPLFWSARGIYARQRRGLVRCDPAGSGCARVWAPPEPRRVVDARAAGADEALVLVRDYKADSELELPGELYRVSLEGGRSELLFTAPEGVYLAEIDWVDTP
ncbi:MAG: hypothetical protein WEF50_19095 [Myxococcota bacterium]